MSFIQTDRQWHFSSELELEKVVWRNLPALLNVKPLRRQFSVEGKVCDLLAVDSAGSLVIIELKNNPAKFCLSDDSTSHRWAVLSVAE